MRSDLVAARDAGPFPRPVDSRRCHRGGGRPKGGFVGLARAQHVGELLGGEADGPELDGEHEQARDEVAARLLDEVAIEVLVDELRAHASDAHTRERRACWREE